MFGRTKVATSEEEQATTTPVKVGGKGRPTPKRREAQQANKRPLVGAPVARGGTKEERKAQREAARAERIQSRAAMMAGDERALPARDRGPARRWTRDYVDGRYNAGEFFIWIAVAAVLLSLVNIPAARLGSMVLLYATVIVVAMDCLYLRRRVNRLATEKFGAEAAHGAGGYALMRSLQLRRGRMPRVQVQRSRRKKA